MTTLVGPIDVEEVRPVLFDFTGELKTGETLAAVSPVEVTVQAGLDPTPANLLSGSAVISGSMVQQLVKGSVNNVFYHLRCVATTSLGSTLVVVANLRVETF